MLAHREVSPRSPNGGIAESCRKQDIEPDQLTRLGDADHGSSMRSKPVVLLPAVTLGAFYTKTAWVESGLTSRTTIPTPSLSSRR